MADELLQQRVRLFIFEHFLEHSAPPVVEQLMNEFSLSRAGAAETLRDLEAARHIALVRVGFGGFVAVLALMLLKPF